MDLRSGFPRSMRVKVSGHVHVARMLDKCRAVLAGTEGEYIYPCPMDERLLEFAGITSDQFTASPPRSRPILRMKVWPPGSHGPPKNMSLKNWKNGIRNYCPGGPVRPKARSGSRCIGMRSILPAPTSRPGRISKIWRKDGPSREGRERSGHEISALHRPHDGLPFPHF